MKEKKLIKENDIIYNIVTAYPELKSKLISLSKKFEKLNNPILFNTVAKVTTVKKASEVAGIYINEFLYELNDAIGLSKEFLEKKKKEIFSKKETIRLKDTQKNDKERPAWFKKTKEFETIDVRDIEEPFFKVVEIAKSKKVGEGFVILQKFKPIPLITYLETLGFESFTEFKEDLFYIYFYRTNQEEKNDRSQ